MLGLVPDDPSAVTFQTALGQPLCYPLFGFAGVALRNLIEKQDIQEQARRKAEALAAAGEERTRLAREMHDSLAKTLRGIALAAAALPVWVGRDLDRAIVEAERIAAATEIASREARDLLSELREDTVTKPLAQAVRDTAERWGEQQGMIVRCSVDDDAELPLLARYEAVSVLSEALANVARHADAHSVDVGVTREDEGVVLTIHDDGCGFEVPEARELARGGHYGLIGLRERAQRVGGTVTLSSQIGAGTTVTARFLAGTTDRSLAEVR
jgi:signal transduction histidine kinase